MGQFSFLQLLGLAFLVFFFGIFGHFWCFWGFSGGLRVLGVLVSHKITRGTILVVGRVNDWV